MNKIDAEKTASEQTRYAWLEGCRQGYRRLVRLFRGLRADRSGAVYVEFLLAFMPVFLMFQCLFQYSIMLTAKQIVMYSAVTSARAASVVIFDDPAQYEGEATGSISGKRLEDIEKAARIPLVLHDSIGDYVVTYPTSKGGTDNRLDGYGPNDIVRTRVEATFVCQIPLAQHILCQSAGSGSQKRTRTITSESAMPIQGAKYQYTPESATTKE